MASRLVLAAALFFGTSACSENARAPRVAICDIAANPAAFDGRTIQTRAFYRAHAHGSYFAVVGACDFVLVSDGVDASAHKGGGLSAAMDDAEQRNRRSCDSLLPETLVTGRVSVQPAKQGDRPRVSIRVASVDDVRLVSAIERNEPGWQLLLPENPDVPSRYVGPPGKEKASCRPYS